MRARLALLAAVTAAGIASPLDAHAIPAFARRTGMACTACHVSWPKLTDFGEAYKDRGYRVRDDDPNLPDHSLDYVPVAIRTTTGYLGTSVTHQPTTIGDTTVRTGGMLPLGADLLYGTSLSKHVSVLFVATGFADDGFVTLESNWARINDIGTPWANLKVGKHELDLPVSEHRSYSLTADYLLYHYHPEGSLNGFSIGDNQLGFEVAGHGDGPGLRYAVSLISAGGNPGSANAFSAPAAYGHATWTVLPRSRLLARVRLGVFGDAGEVPTAFRTDPATTEPVPGTGTVHKPFYQGGADASVSVGSLARPLDLTIAALYGHEDKGLIPGAARDPSWYGGFFLVEYTPVLELTVYGRAEAIANGTQSDPALPSSTGDASGGVLGIRHAVWFSPWGGATAHFEGSVFQTRTPGPTVATSTVLAGIDFAF